MEDPYPSIYVTLIGDLGITYVSFYIFSGVLFALLLYLSALISGSEVAFFSLNHGDLATCRTSSSSQDKRIISLLQGPQRLLATILIMNNLVNITIVTLATYVTWEILGSKSADGYIVAVLTVITTLAIVFFGEVVPKVYANQNNLSFARSTSGLLNVADTIFRPVSWLLLSISSIVEKRVERKGYNVSIDELNHALELTAETEATEEEKGILKGIVNFGTLTVTQVMRSRVDITAIDFETDFHELMDQINKTGYSRIPIYKETVDKIEGVLYIKDLLPFVDKDENFLWQNLMRPAFFVPESKRVDALFKDFQEKRVHMAIVVDEYGGTSGLVTLEDLIEEIVGEINDEFDNEDEIAYNKLDSNTYVFEGKISLNDFCKVVSVEGNIFDTVRGDSESLGGLILEINSKLPNVGEKIRFERFVFTVVSADNKRIKRVRVFINPSFQAESIQKDK
jgi:putative hemolysin